jgi:hypothetical protein
MSSSRRDEDVRNVRERRLMGQVGRDKVKIVGKRK